MIHVFVGTQAEYIKMAPLLWRMESAGLPYRLIDSGQHADRSESFRDELGLRAPDYAMGGTRSVDSVPAAMWWAAGLSRKLVHCPGGSIEPSSAGTRGSAWFTATRRRR